MIYEIRQTTEYEYAKRVPSARHVLRMLPVNRPGLTIIHAEVKIRPQPANRREDRDFFGNACISVQLDKLHDNFCTTSTILARVEAPPPILLNLTPGWEQASALAFESSDLGPLSPVHFLFASRLVPLESKIAAYALESFTPDRPILAAAEDFMHRVYADFKYDPEATDVTSTPIEAFEQKSGVCQDFAHVMISGLRALGIPAAYVSGYLRTVPAPGQPRLQGADAMHAWVAVWCGYEAGWRALDPTNDTQVGEDHIPLAFGRDYSDVAPVSGILLGPGEQKLNVGVDVVPTEFAMS